MQNPFELPQLFSLSGVKLTNDLTASEVSSGPACHNGGGCENGGGCKSGGAVAAEIAQETQS